MRFNTQLGATQSSANKALGAVKTLAKGAAIGTGVGLGYAIKKAADFEQQLDSLGSVSGATGRELEKLRKQAMKAGADTKFSALDAAKAQTELAKGGASVAQIAKGGLKSALALAAAGELDLALAAETSANAMNLFALEGKDAMKVADQLATAANATTADVEDFAVALKMGGSVAKIAGLSFTETVLALEALAKIGIRNSDAGTSMKTAFLQLIGPTEKQAKLQKKLGLSFIDSEGNMRGMAEIAAMLRDKLGEMGNAQRAATLKVLAGTDGIRTLAALYDAGPAKLDKWKAGLEKSGTAAKVAAEKQDNLKGKLENLQGSIETIAIAIGSKMLPSLTKAAEKVTDILNDPKLTASEKLQKLGDMVSDAINRGVEKAVKTVGTLAPRVAEAFARGWWNAGIWTKLVVGGWLLSKFGGVKAFAALGQLVGRAFGVNIAMGAATAAAGGGAAGGAAGGGMLGAMRGKLLPFAKRVGLAGVGIALADSVISEFGRRSAEKGPDMFKALKAAQGPKPLGVDIFGAGGTTDFFLKESEKAARSFAPALEQIAKSSSKITPHRAGELREELAKMDGLSTPVRRQINALIDTAQRRFTDGREATAHWNHAVADMVRDSQGKFAGMRTNVQFNTKLIRKALKDESGAGRKALAANLDEIVDVIRRTMRRGGKVTEGGMALIKKLFVNELTSYGLSPRAALAGANVRTGEVRGGFRRQDQNQRGAYIDRGAPSGDSVPSLLERGEYVLNRNAVRKVGKKNLDRLNFAAAPRFQQGGIAGMTAAANKLDAAHFPYVWGGGHQGSPAPFGPMDCSGAVSFVLQHGGLKVPTMVASALMGAGSPGAGKATVFANAGHTFMRIGGRYFGTSGTNPGGGAGWMPDPGAGYRSGFVQRHFKGVGGALGVPRVMVDGPDSALKSVVQGALDKTRSGANQRLDALTSASIGAGDAGDPGPGFSGPWVKVLEQIAKARNWSAGDWKKLVQGESGGDPTALNPSSGAFGLGQFLGRTKDAYAKYGATSTDPVMQIQAMAKYILDRYGNPTNAYNTWLARDPHWYAQGGLVGMTAGGPPPLARSLNRAVNIVGGLNQKGKRFPAKRRSKALHGFLDRIKKIDLPPNLQKNLSRFQKDADIFGDMADRAGVLTVDGPDGNSIQGVVGGLTEGEWLTKQLEALFKFRNALIKAEKIVAAKREKIVRLVEQAAKRLKALAAQIRTAGNVKKGLEKQLKAAQKHPKKNAALIKDLKGTIKGIDRDQGVRTRERGVLKNRILPALTGRRDMFGTALRDDIRPGIEAVQGLGSPMKVLKALPEVGVLGGDILATQIRLRDLNEKPNIVDATTDDSGRADLLAGLLREANLRTAVSQAQYQVLRNMPPYGGSFATGGVVPGPLGSPRVIVAHGGETVSPVGASVQVIVNGDIVNTPRGKRPIEVRDVRARHRPLPGRGGGS
jgi:TP901 family phage tail tape measure protein